MTNDIFDIVKDKVDIVSLVEMDETLNREGSRYSGSHNACHGSEGQRCLMIYPDTQSWYCFHCNEGGSVIDYVMARDNCNAIEAVNWLCETFNIERPDWTPEQKAEFKRQQNEKKTVRPLVKECFEFYHERMTDEQRAYYHERGLTDETIDSFLLGYAEKNNELFSHMLQKYSNDNINKLLKTGLFFKFDTGIRDRYKDRYVIPYWYRDDIVFSIARSIDPKAKAKYVKHLKHDKYSYVSDSAVKHIIYNEDKARGADEIVITEGIFDVLLAIQTGYTAISPVTTQFSNSDNERLAELTAHAETVYILNDNEKTKAGEVGAVKTAKVLMQNEVNVKIATIPRPEDKEKVDLADFIVEHKDEARVKVDELLENAKSLLNFQLDQVSRDIDRLELFEKIEKLLKEQLELKQSKDRLRMWLDTQLKDKFNLKARDIQNYQTMLTRLETEHDELLKEKKRKERQREKQERLEKLKEQDDKEYLKAIIEDARTEQYKKAFQIKQTVSQIVLKDMLSRGKFYKTKTRHFYYFNEHTKALIEIGDQTFEHYANDRYNLNSTETDYEYLVADLEAHTGNYGEMTEVYRFSYYDVDSKNLYIDRNDNQVYRLNGETIDLLPNGSDNVLFLTDDTFESFKIVDIESKEFIKELLIEPVSFVADEDVNLNNKQQQIVLKMWIRSLFFEELQPTKPILTFIGEPESGKTTLQRKVGRFLFGKEFNVQGVNEEKDFLATITHNYLASFDNVDSDKDWLCDRLCQVATGQRLEMRELYTTNQVARYYPRCFLNLSSANPHFKRNDVVSRLLLLKLKKVEQKKSERELQKEIADNRNELWTELLYDLNEIVKALKTDNESFTTRHRMADFAELGWRIAKIEGAGEVWLEILDHMEKERHDFMIADTPVYKCIDGLLSKKYEIKDKTTAELFELFKNYSANNEIDFDIENTMTLAQFFSNYLKSLEKIFNVSREKKRRRWRYTFSLKEC